MESSNLACPWCPAPNPGTVLCLLILVLLRSLLLCDKLPGHLGGSNAQPHTFMGGSGHNPAGPVGPQEAAAKVSAEAALHLGALHPSHPRKGRSQPWRSGGLAHAGCLPGAALSS